MKGGETMITTTDMNKEHALCASVVGRICNTKIPGSEMTLKKGTSKRLARTKQWGMVSCVEGEIWITQEHDLKDYVLGPGDAFFITLPGVVVVQALRDSRVEIMSSLQRSSYAGRSPVFH
jgi:hypothetical protein